MKNEFANVMIFEGHNVEVFEWNGKILFNPYHVGNCLDLGESAVKMAITKMNGKQVIKLTNSKVKDVDFRKLHNTGENFLTESGVYKLIFKSHKPEAEKFQDWVTDEVLPTIRKHGIYATDSTIETILNNPDTMIAVLQELKSEREQKIALQKENTLLIPDAKMANDLMKYNGLYTLKEIADLIECGRTELCTLLRIGKVLSKQSGYNLPLRKFIESGYFKVKIHSNTKVPVTLIAPKGLKFIYRLIKKLDMTDEFNSDLLISTYKDSEVA